MKKIIIGGVLAGLVIMVVGFISGSMLEGLYRLSPAGIFKTPNLTNLIVYYFVVGLILAYVYSILKNAVPGNGMQKGMIFGFLVFLVGTIPGLGITWITMTVRNRLLFWWAVFGLVEMALAGAAIAFVDEKTA